MDDAHRWIHNATYLGRFFPIGTRASFKDSSCIVICIFRRKRRGEGHRRRQTTHQTKARFIYLKETRASAFMRWLLHHLLWHVFTFLLYYLLCPRQGIFIESVLLHNLDHQRLLPVRTYHPWNYRRPIRKVQPLYPGHHFLWYYRLLLDDCDIRGRPSHFLGCIWFHFRSK